MMLWASPSTIIKNAAKRSKQLKIRIFNNNLEVFNSQNGAFRS